jgi:methionine aminotransferase
MSLTQNLGSKLPDTGTSIFTVMSQMAHQEKALNLSQGFPDFEVSPELIDRIYYYLQKGNNQYAPSPGIFSLRRSIARMNQSLYAVDNDPDQEITITAGATEALFSSITALIQPGDEVILLEPCYDAYRPVITLNQGIPVSVRLKPETFEPYWEQVAQAITKRTKAILINTPHNPSGKVMSHEDMQHLESLAVENDLIVMSDEVYNHLVYDRQSHRSVLQYPGLKDRSIAIFSFGKTFHATGWKVGYAIAQPHITREIRKVHQFVTFSVHTPTQHAVADFLEDLDRVQQINQVFQLKRDLFLSAIKGADFEWIPSQGSYFQILSYGKKTTRPAMELSEYYTRKQKLASIPV